MFLNRPHLIHNGAFYRRAFDILSAPAPGNSQTIVTKGKFPGVHSGVAGGGGGRAQMELTDAQLFLRTQTEKKKIVQIPKDPPTKFLEFEKMTFEGGHPPKKREKGGGGM